MSYPIITLRTARATYWEVAKGVYQATDGRRPTNQAGYRSLLAIMQQKGEPWEVRVPVMQHFRNR